MDMDKLSNVDVNKLFTIAGVVSVVIVAFYATGLYRNILQIEKLKQEGSKPLPPEQL